MDTDSLLSQNWPPSPSVRWRSCSETESATTDKNGRKKTEKNAWNATEFLIFVDLGKIWPPLVECLWWSSGRYISNALGMGHKWGFICCTSLHIIMNWNFLHFICCFFNDVMILFGLFLFPTGPMAFVRHLGTFHAEGHSTSHGNLFSQSLLFGEDFGDFEEMSAATLLERLCASSMNMTTHYSCYLFHVFTIARRWTRLNICNWYAHANVINNFGQKLLLWLTCVVHFLHIEIIAKPQRSQIWPIKVGTGWKTYAI